MIEIVVLRLVHVLGGIFWVGSGLFMSVFLLPSLARSPHAPQVFAGLQERRLFTVMPIVALLTILSGLRLMWIMSAGFGRAYFSTPAGHTYAIAGSAALLAFLIGIVIARPTGLRSTALAAQLAGAPDDATRERLTAELTRLRKRSVVTGLVATVLIVFAAAGMAVARYM